MDKQAMAEVRTMEQVGAVLRAAREGQGITQQQMADALGVSRGAYNRWERGLREGGCCEITKAGMALGLRPDSVFLRRAVPVEGPTSWEPLLADPHADAFFSELSELCILCQDLEESPVRVFLDHLRTIRSVFRQVSGGDTTRVSVSVEILTDVQERVEAAARAAAKLVVSPDASEQVVDESGLLASRLSQLSARLGRALSDALPSKAENADKQTGATREDKLG